MKRSVVVVLVGFIALAAGATAAAAEYDQDVVVGVMRSNVTLMGEIQDAVTAGDFFTAADKLYAIGTGMRQLLPFDPPAGQKAAWDATVTRFVTTAYVGVGAAAQGDVGKLNEVISELRMLNRQGHGDFRPR